MSKDRQRGHASTDDRAAIGDRNRAVGARRPHIRHQPDDDADPGLHRGGFAAQDLRGNHPSGRPTSGTFVYDLGNQQWDIPRLRELLEKIILKDTLFEDFEVEHDFPHLGFRQMLLNARRIHHREGGEDLILLAIEDVTDRKLAAKADR